MASSNYSIGTEPKRVVSKDPNHNIDFIIQNLSANNIYFGEDTSVAPSTGTKITSMGSLAKDDWSENIYLIADTGTANDVRITIQSVKRIK